MHLKNETKLIKFITTSLYILGLWPETSWKKLYKIYSYVLHFVITFLFILFMLIYLANNINDVDKTTDSLYPIITILGFIFKIINYYRYGDNIIKCSEKLLKIQIKKSDETIFNSYLAGLTKLTSFLYCVTNITVCVACSKMFLGSNKDLPVPSQYPIDWRDGNTLHFWIVYLHESFGGFIMVNANIGMDCLAYYLMGMVAARFEILNSHIRHLGMNIDLEDKHQTKELESTRFSMKLYIHEHQQIIELVTDINRNFSLQFVSQVYLSAIILGAGMYQVTTLSPFDNFFQFTFVVTFIVTITTQTFLYTYYGNGIVTTSELLSNALYSSNWILMPTLLRKDLIIVAERAKTRCELIAGELFPLNLTLFTSIINFAYRLYTVLKGVS